MFDNVRHRITSAYHPHSNDLDERTYQTLKQQNFHVTFSIHSLPFQLPDVQKMVVDQDKTK